MSGAAERLDKARHVKYWQRCHSTYLPPPYTSADSTRLMWACFIFSAFDVLSVPVKDRDRATIRAWVLSLQHPDGGFCGSPNHAYAGQSASKGDANLAATFFALVLLAVAADGSDECAAKSAFAGVHRRKLLTWLRRLQREDGSFGQNLWDGRPVGGQDTRHSYLASSIRWMLRGDVQKGDEAWVEDVDTEAMVAHIRRLQTYDGGLAEFSQQESHAGYVYCAIAALSLLGRPASSASSPKQPGSATNQGVADLPALLNFLAGRQFVYLHEEEEKDDEDDGENFVLGPLGPLSIEEKRCHVGFNGRWNKKADTCYCWWVAGTLEMLGSPFPVSVNPSRSYLLDITQHQIGGFAKHAGAPPDLYHSYLGLAALATMGDEDLKEFDVGLCCSMDTTRKIEQAREGLLDSVQHTAAQTWTDDGFWA